MENNDKIVLPYRTESEDLIRLVKNRARGRDLEQIETLNFSKKNFDGTVTAAGTLGFLNQETGDLTAKGRKFALGSPEEKKSLLLDSMLKWEPYDLLLDAIFDRKDEATTLEWIETWWATHGYGNSESNRSEGSTAFARFVEFVGFGSYLQGRRGHQSRIEWEQEAAERIAQGRKQARQDSVQDESAESSRAVEQIQTRAVDSRDEPRRQVVDHGPPSPSDNLVHLKLPLGEGRRVEVRLPQSVTPSERDRIMTLLPHLMNVEEANEVSAPEQPRTTSNTAGDEDLSNNVRDEVEEH